MEIALLIWQYFCLACGVVCIASLAVYLLPALLLSFARPQNLRKKYNATWALVTGGSSGIGKAIARKFVSQGLNVAIVGLDDSLMSDSVEELSDLNPVVTVLPIAVNLGQADPEGYMAAIREKTADLPISIVVNNAGMLKLSFFSDLDPAICSTVMNVNCVSSVHITLHFYRRMIDEGRKGCILVTSSAAHYMPAPFATLYGGTKAFLTSFNSSLAIEAAAHGIDITVFQPSFTSTNLYANAPKVGALKVLSAFAWSSEQVADAMFKYTGRLFVADIGSYALSTYLFGRLIDTNALASVILPFRDSMAPPGSVKSKRN